MHSTAVISDIGLDYKTNKAKITFLCDNKDILKEAEELQNIKVNIEAKKYKQKRSLDANRYFWKLLEEYSEEKEINTIEEYKQRVKRLGIFKQFRIECKDIKTFMIMWQKNGIAWFCEVHDTECIGNLEFKIINAYYGSSSYNRKQMSRLIDDLVEDCKEIGIETMAPAELSRLKEEWGSIN